jgi:hypothetical protein
MSSSFMAPHQATNERWSEDRGGDHTAVAEQQLSGNCLNEKHFAALVLGVSRREDHFARD